MSNPDDFLFAGGAKSAKFEAVGDFVKGTIVSTDVRQQSDPDGNLKTWKDGSPMNQLVIVLATDLRDSDDDDGHRAVYVKGGQYEVASGKGTSMRDAIRDAVKTAGGTSLTIGSTLTVAHTGLGKKTQAAYSAPKLYGAKWEPAAVSVAALSGDFDPLA